MAVCRVVAVAICALCVGCLNTHNSTCGSLTCPDDLVCSAAEICVSPDQIAACSGMMDGESCTFGQGPAEGFCHDETCVVSLNVCGDGVVDAALGEQCDCGTSAYLTKPPIGCNGFNSDLPGATCRPNCKPGRCGDGILDPGELCDDGNNVSFDGCRADCQGRFEAMDVPTGFDLYAIWATEGAAVAVGEYGTSIVFDGSSWSSQVVCNAQDLDLQTVWASSLSDIYCGGGSGLSHYDGQSVTVVPGLPALFSVDTVWGTSATDVWAGGQNNLNDLEFWHFNGTSWSAVTLPSACTDQPTSAFSPGIDKIWGPASNEIYVATGVALCYFNGTSWSVVDTDTAYLLTGTTSVVYVAGGGEDTDFDSLAIGGSSVVHYGQPPGTYGSLAMPDSDELLAAGANGLVLQFDTATNTWTHLVTPTDVGLTAVTGTRFGNVFVLGVAGTVLH